MSVSLLRGRTVRRALSVLVVAGLLGAGVTGCSNDAGAKTENTIDASPTPTNTTTDGDGDSTEEPVENTPAEPEQRPTPVEPEAMKTGDKAGAIAAAQFFVEVFDYDARTSSTTLMDKYAYKKCTLCNEMRSDKQRLIDEGEISFWAEYSEAEYINSTFVGDEEIIWEVDTETSYLEHVRSLTSNEITSTRTDLILTMQIGWLGDRWELVSLGYSKK
ncbi:DUF6318 family protein [Jonesia denitrificans]|nr:DUF6318 family protein [Jonesia denitrificans]